jgi:hypothetical protein
MADFSYERDWNLWVIGDSWKLAAALSDHYTVKLAINAVGQRLREFFRLRYPEGQRIDYEITVRKEIDADAVIVDAAVYYFHTLQKGQIVTVRYNPKPKEEEPNLQGTVIP